MAFQDFSLPDDVLLRLLLDVHVEDSPLDENHLVDRVDRAIANAATRAALQAVVQWLREFDPKDSSGARVWYPLDVAAETLEAVLVISEEATRQEVNP